MKLLASGPSEVKKLIDDYENEVREIKKNCLHLSWYLRGGATYEDVLNMSNEERLLIKDIIEHNLEITKKTQMPFI